jgi:hyperosmotically inducible protein
MNSIAIHKIVVGIGLAAAFAVGVSVVAVRAKHDSQFARNAPAAPVDQNATDVTTSALSAPTQTPADPTAIPSSAPPANPPVAAPAPVAPTASNDSKDGAGKPASDESKLTKSKASDRAERYVVKTRNSGDTSGIRVASAAHSNKRSADESASNSSDSVKSSNELAPVPSLSDKTSSTPASATADTQSAPAQTGQEAARNAGPAATSNEPVALDSQITAYVKSEMATAAPNSNIDSTTTNGVVALAGSLPSQDAVEKARQAARGVAGVKYVDVSALTVSNQ